MRPKAQLVVIFVLSAVLIPASIGWLMATASNPLLPIFVSYGGAIIAWAVLVFLLNAFFWEN